ncbi:MAG: ROK family transcriptional regulator [Clostridia bacterium]|nr:ROK family transcriptional regulator [Clostridia bacterium]
MHQLNLSMVLNLIRRSNNISRSALAQMTGMTAATVANLVNELLDLGYLEYAETGESTGGRKPVLLRLCPCAEYAVGIELTASHILGVIGNLQADVLVRSFVVIDPKEGKDAVIDAMVNMVEDLIIRSGLRREQLSGLGLALPGPCDYHNGIVLNPPNFPDWKYVPIRDILSERLGMKVLISKESASDGLAEYWFGGAVDNERIFTVHVGMVGIGGAFIDQGSVFRYDVRESMDIGHNTVEMNGYPCACGSRGCLEAHANGIAALRYAREYASAEGRRPEVFANVESVIFGAEAGDAACVQAIDKCADYLSMALRNVILLLTPDRIFCGGSFAERCPRLVEAVSERLKGYVYPECGLTPLEHFSFGRENGAIGALALVFGSRLNDL